MSDSFLGEIRLIGFNFAPQGWALCNGQLLPINQNQALYSLLGTTWGGNGQVNFALPNLGAIRLDRFSPNYTEAEQLGIRNVRPDRSYRYVYGLPDDELAELAYYFEHDYADGRDPESYVGELRDAAVQWHANSASRGLIYMDHDRTLAVWDFRAGAEQTVTLLEGMERELYLFDSGLRLVGKRPSVSLSLMRPHE